MLDLNKILYSLITRINFYINQGIFRVQLIIINYKYYINNMKKEFKVKCKNCGKIFTVIEEETKFPIKGDKYFCCRSCANTRHHSEETKQKISKGVRTSEIFIQNNKLANLNKIGKFRNSGKIHFCKNCGKQLNYNEIVRYGKYLYCSDECKNIYLTNNTHGGYRIGSGIGKHGWYKGFYCDSTWELAFLIYHLDHNLYIERCKEYRKYTINNKEHIYIPDFITNEGIIEIKGYKTKESEAKRLQNPDIKCIYREDIYKYIEYVKHQYNVNNIQDLYE